MHGDGRRDHVEAKAPARRGWHADAEGRRQGYEALPRHIGKLADDPYRSLAGELRRAGGYAKVDILYAEFLWATFLRQRIKPSRLSDGFDPCVGKALTFSIPPIFYPPDFLPPTSGRRQAVPCMCVPRTCFHPTDVSGWAGGEGARGS